MSIDESLRYQEAQSQRLELEQQEQRIAFERQEAEVKAHVDEFFTFMQSKGNPGRTRKTLKGVLLPDFRENEYSRKDVTLFAEGWKIVDYTHSEGYADNRYFVDEPEIHLLTAEGVIKQREYKYESAKITIYPFSKYSIWDDKLRSYPRTSVEFEIYDSMAYLLENNGLMDEWRRRK